MNCGLRSRQGCIGLCKEGALFYTQGTHFGDSGMLREGRSPGCDCRDQQVIRATAQRVEVGGRPWHLKGSQEELSTCGKEKVRGRGRGQGWGGVGWREE